MYDQEVVKIQKMGKQRYFASTSLWIFEERLPVTFVKFVLDITFKRVH